MTLHEILLKFMASKEAKIRLGNRQIFVNSEVATDGKTEMEVEDDYEELGNFMFLNFDKWHNVIPAILPFRDFFGPEPTNVKSCEWLTHYTLVKVGKWKEYVFKHIR
jgi:hypothetical protein